MNQDLFSNCLLLIEGLAFINLLYLFGSGPLVKLSLARTFWFKVRQVVVLCIGTGLMLALLGGLIYAVVFTAIKGFHDIVGMLCVCGGGTLVVAVAGYRAMFKYARSVNKASAVWIEWAEERYGERLNHAVHGIFSLKSAVHGIALGITQFGCIVLLATDPQHGKMPNWVSVDTQAVGYAAAFAVGVLASLYSFQRFISPSHTMLESCMRYFYGLGEERNPLRVGVSRWRTPEHKLAFKAAGSLSRTLAGIRKKLAPRDAERVERAYLTVAQRMREGVINLRSGHFDEEFARLCVAAVALAVDENPMAACRYAEEVLGGSFSDEPKPRSKIIQALGYIDGIIQRYSTVLKVGIGVALLLFLLGSGQFATVVEIIRQVVAR